MLQNIFRTASAPTGGNDNDCAKRQIPCTISPLMRSGEYKAAFEVWQRTAACREWQNQLRQEFGSYQTACKMAENTHEWLAFSEMKCKRGFTIRYKENAHATSDFAFLFDFFCQQLQKYSYTMHTADTHVYHCSDVKTETMHRYYLKPKCERQPNQKLKQHFGNITLVVYYIKDVPSYIECRATHYRDFKLFEPSENLHALMNCLLSK